MIQMPLFSKTHRVCACLKILAKPLRPLVARPYTLLKDRQRLEKADTQ